MKISICLNSAATSIVLMQHFTQVNGQNSLACAGVTTGNFVRNSASCKMYYYCDGVIAHSGACPRDLMFNSRFQTCDLAHNVDCYECSARGVQHLQHPTSCNSYYRCTNGVRTTVTCSANLTFDLATGECSATASKDHCTLNVCVGRSGYHTVGNPYDCTK